MATDGFYDDYVETCSSGFVEDRLRKMCTRIPKTTEQLLDVGSGRGRNLALFAKLFPAISLTGTDISANGVEAIRALGFRADVCDASLALPYDDASFDVVTCGEVIEHVVDTDHLLAEIRRVLRPGGRLILTTPNLAYLPNRLLLLCGIQPLFTETSLKKNLGRRWRALGQGGATQGHLKVFTAAATRDILRESGFRIASFEGYAWLASGLSGRIDGVLAGFPSLSAGFVVDARPELPR